MRRRFLGALQFLTTLPVSGATAAPGECAAFFPLVGALLGALCGGTLMLFSTGLTHSISAWLALIVLLGATGCLHEDGLADVADAVRVGRGREKMMDILKDSRIGTYGAVALIVSLALRGQALALSPANPVPGLIATLSLSRASLVILAGIAPSVGAGLGKSFAAACSRNVLLLVAVQALGIAAVSTPWKTGLAMCAATLLVIFCARAWFTRRLGGVNGDCLGATCQAVEIVNLVILAWHPSI